MPSDPPEDGHLLGAAPEEELLRLEEDAAYRRELAEMRRIRPDRLPPAETGFIAGDAPC